MKLTLADVCRILQVDQATVYRWMQEDDLPAQKVNGVLHFHRSDLLEWATLHNRRFHAEILQDADFRNDSLSDALRRGGIFHDVPGTDAASLLSNVVARLPLPAALDREQLTDLFIAREHVASTGIGGGIAVPHPRHPTLVPGRPASVTLCFTEHPVPCGASDGQPVTALFATIAPNPRIHLQLLARLAIASRDLGFLQCLRLQQSQEMIFTELQRHESQLSGDTVPESLDSTYTRVPEASASGGS